MDKQNGNTPKKCLFGKIVNVLEANYSTVRFVDGPFIIVVVVDGFASNTGTFQLSMTCPISCEQTVFGSNAAAVDSFNLPDLPNGNNMIRSLVLASSTVVLATTCTSATNYDTIILLLY